MAKREAALAEGEKALAEQRQLSLLGAEEAPVTPTLIWEAAMAREQGKERARMEAAALRNAARADSLPVAARGSEAGAARILSVAKRSAIFQTNRKHGRRLAQTRSRASRGVD